MTNPTFATSSQKSNGIVFRLSKSTRGRFNAGKRVGGRVKPGHDDRGSNAIAFELPQVFSTPPQLPLKEP